MIVDRLKIRASAVRNGMMFVSPVAFFSRLQSKYDSVYLTHAKPINTKFTPNNASNNCNGSFSSRGMLVVWCVLFSQPPDSIRFLVVWYVSWVYCFHRIRSLSNIVVLHLFNIKMMFELLFVWVDSTIQLQSEEMWESAKKRTEIDGIRLSWCS